MQLSGDGFPSWWWLWMAGIGGAILFGLFQNRKRNRAIAALASRHRLHIWSGEAPPKDFSWVSRLLKDGRISNCYEGELAGARVAILDYRQGSGKSAQSTTVIAVKTNTDVFADREFKFSEERIGDWRLLYQQLDRNSKRMDVAELGLLIGQLTRHGKITRMPLTHSSP